jgi:hypothetical protein
MARIVVAQRARTDLARLVETHSLPADTVPRVQAAIEPLATFPEMGKRLTDAGTATGSCSDPGAGC